MNYAVCEISGRQYKVEPGKSFLVDFLGEDAKDFVCDKVLLFSDGKDLKIGDPYLSLKLNFKITGQTKDKIRVATYHAKANTRRVKGAKVLKSRIILEKEKKEG